MPFIQSSKLLIDGAICPVPGVYGILDATYRVIYIGEAEDIGDRLEEHMRNWNHIMHKYRPMYYIYEVNMVDFLRKAREEELIKEYQPPANKQHVGILPRDIFGWPSVF